MGTNRKFRVWGNGRAAQIFNVEYAHSAVKQYAGKDVHWCHGSATYGCAYYTDGVHDYMCVEIF